MDSAAEPSVWYGHAGIWLPLHSNDAAGEPIVAQFWRHLGNPTPLSRKLREALGPEAGDDLVTWMHEIRSQGDSLRADIRADFAEFRNEIRADIRASELRLLERMHQMEVRFTQELHVRIAESEQRLGQRISEVDKRITEVEVRVAAVKADLMKWSFVFWVGAVAAIAMLAEVLP